MANELRFTDPTNVASGLSTVLFVLRANDGRIVNASTGALMTLSSGNIASAAISAADTGHLYNYWASVPANTPAGKYDVTAHVKAGANLAFSDPVKGVGELRWNGTAEVDALPNAAAGTTFGLPLKSDLPEDMSGLLTGPLSVTLRFDDENGDPVPYVRFTIVGVGSVTAGLSGTQQVGLVEGIYTIRAGTTMGVFFADTNITVTESGQEFTIHGSPTAITPAANPSQTTAYTTTYDEHGNPEAGVDIVFQQLRTPIRASSGSFDSAPFTVTSDDNGLIQVTLLQKTVYQWKRGSGQNGTFTTGGSSTYQLPPQIGKDV
jgi:hypothetical protein